MIPKLRRFLGVSIAVLTLIVVTAMSPARAALVPVTGGTTTIFLTSELLLNGLPVGGVMINPLGGATKNAGPVSELLLPITGGTFDTTTGDLVLQHVGSGFQFEDLSNEVNVNDLIIDTAAGTVDAMVSGVFGLPVPPTDETVFSIFLSTFLISTPALDNILNGLDPEVPNGFVFGVLSAPDIATDTAIIPLPLPLPLLGAAFVAFGFLGWRRRKSEI